MNGMGKNLLKYAIPPVFWLGVWQLAAWAVGRELLLPAIKQCVLEVDVEAGFIRIHILEGLLDGA